MLLDTHVVVWLFDGNPRLAQSVRRAIESADEVHVSAVTMAEVAIKTSLGKLTVHADLMAAIPEVGFEHAPFRAEHAWRMRQLPRLHGDPFDRMLIAQAQTDALTLVTDDAAIKQYDVAQL